MFLVILSLLIVYLLGFFGPFTINDFYRFVIKKENISVGPIIIFALYIILVIGVITLITALSI